MRKTIGRVLHGIKRMLFWLSWPGLFVYFLLHHRSRVLLRAGDKVLLVKGGWKRLFDDDGFGVPGGGIGRGETPAQGAARELAEELGMHISPAQLRPLGEGKVREYGLGYQAYFFVVDISESTAFQLQKNEIVEARWVALPETLQMRLKPETRLALELAAQLSAK